MVWIDTHCHLDAAEFEADRAAVLARAGAAGVVQLVVPAVSAGGFESVRALAAAPRRACTPAFPDGAGAGTGEPGEPGERGHGGSPKDAPDRESKRPTLSYALGIHPLFTGDADDTDLDRLDQALTDAAQDPALVAVGEIGLDGWVPGLDWTRQRRFYEAQLKLARKHDLPVILHVRRSADALLQALRRIEVPGGIAHAFNGSRQQADAFIGLGFALGFGGAMTFDQAHRIRRLAVGLPPEALVLETDAPDIPPRWIYRTAAERAAGATSRNEPAELPRIGAELAALRGWGPEETAAVTRANAHRVLPRLRPAAKAAPA